jgi:hypothetical protein
VSGGAVIGQADERDDSEHVATRSIPASHLACVLVRDQVSINCGCRLEQSSIRPGRRFRPHVWRQRITAEGAVRAELAELILTGSRVELPALIGLTGFNMVSQHAALDSSQGSRTQATSKVEETAVH